MILDKGIRLRLSQVEPESAEEKLELEKIRKLYKQLQPFYYMALSLYLLLPIWDTPAWCIVDIRLAVSNAR